MCRMWWIWNKDNSFSFYLWVSRLVYLILQYWFLNHLSFGSLLFLYFIFMFNLNQLILAGLVFEQLATYLGFAHFPLFDNILMENNILCIMYIWYIYFFSFIFNDISDIYHCNIWYNFIRVGFKMIFLAAFLLLILVNEILIIMLYKRKCSINAFSIWVLKYNFEFLVSVLWCYSCHFEFVHLLFELLIVCWYSDPFLCIRRPRLALPWTFFCLRRMDGLSFSKE